MSLSVNDDLKKVNTPPAEGSTTSQVKPQSEGASKPTIFKGMTEAQAKERGVLDEFNRADTTKDGVISEEEENAYINPTGKSGKRTAQNGIYTVQKGDTLGKIAQDFGLDAFDLYNANKDTIGKDWNIIKEGQQLKITKDAVVPEKTTSKSKSTKTTAKSTKTSKSEKSNSKSRSSSINSKANMEKIIYDKLSKIKVSDNTLKMLSKQYNKDLSGMSTIDLVKKAQKAKVADVVKSVRTVLKTSNKDDIEFAKSILSNGEVDSTLMNDAIASLEDEEATNALLTKMSTILGGKNVSEMTVEDLQKTIEELPDTQKAKVRKALSNQMLDRELDSIEGAENADARDLLKNIYGLKGEASDNEIAKAISKKVLVDLDTNNSNSLINQQLAKIKQNGLTHKEAKQYGEAANLSQQQLVEIACQRVIKMHMKAFANANYESEGKHDYEAILRSTMGFVDCNIKELAATHNVKSAVVGQSVTVAMSDESAPEEFKTAMGAVVANNSDALGVKEMSDNMFAQTTNQVAQYADEDSLNKYSNANSDRADIVKTVYEKVLSETTDTDRQSALKGAISTTEQIIKNGPNGRTGSSTEDGSVSASTNRSAVTNPIYDSKGNDVNALAKQSHAFMSKGRVTPQQLRQEEMQKQQEQIAKEAEELHQKMGVAIAGLKNKPPEKALSIVFDHFDQMPGDKKTEFLNFLKRQFNERHDALCEIYLKGDTKVRQFLQDQHIMTVNDIYKHLDEHPEDMKYASKTMEVNYRAYKSKSLMKDMTPSSDFENKANAMTYSYWPDIDEMPKGWTKINYKQFR